MIARLDKAGRHTVYIYSNLPCRKSIFGFDIREKVPKYDILMPDDEIDRSWPVTLLETDVNTLNHYRNLYLSKKIVPGSGSPAYLVFAGSKLFGFLIFQPYSLKAQTFDIYMMSDFVVPTERYSRLASCSSWCRNARSCRP